MFVCRLGRVNALVLSTQRYLDIRSRVPLVTTSMHCATTSSRLTYHPHAAADDTACRQYLQIGTSSNDDARSAVTIWRSFCDDVIMNRISGFPRHHYWFVCCFVSRVVRSGEQPRVNGGEQPVSSATNERWGAASELRHVRASSTGVRADDLSTSRLQHESAITSQAITAGLAT